MRILQFAWAPVEPSASLETLSTDPEINLAIVFGQRARLETPDVYESLRLRFPNAEIIMGSTSGEIMGASVYDESVAVTAIAFEKTQLRSVQIQLEDCADRKDAAVRIGQGLLGDDLALVLLLADGQNVNGSDLAMGLNEVLEGKVPVAGGLAGDGSNFQKTLVGLNGAPTSGIVAAIGFYGKDLEVRSSSQGGWEPFGPERKVTASRGNLLLKLDGKSALDLYKSYLGEMAADLPSSGLLFPLSIQEKASDFPLVRTLLAIDETENSLTFAGDIPVGATARLMKASAEGLIGGARKAAEYCKSAQSKESELAILVSCVGRKLVLGQRIEEEVEEVRHILGNGAICGFYAYGEISASGDQGLCELHNQTMTITTISER